MHSFGLHCILQSGLACPQSRLDDITPSEHANQTPRIIHDGQPPHFLLQQNSGCSLNVCFWSDHQRIWGHDIRDPADSRATNITPDDPCVCAMGRLSYACLQCFSPASWQHMNMKSYPSKQRKAGTMNRVWREVLSWWLTFGNNLEHRQCKSVEPMLGHIRSGQCKDIRWTHVRPTWKLTACQCSSKSASALHGKLPSPCWLLERCQQLPYAHWRCPVSACHSLTQHPQLCLLRQLLASQ